MSTQQPSVSLPTLGTERPLVLLPVRLETHFNVSQAPTSYYLDVRVYPDEIHTRTHEAGLTADELDWGKQYLDVDEEEGPSAWRQLAARFGPRRAAWIVRTLESNPQQAASRTGTWTTAPTTDVLPDRWIAIGYQGASRVFCYAGSTIPDTLATGPSPTSPRTGVADAGMKWMVDFQEALRVGMALRIPVSSNVAQTGIDRLVVLGVKASLGGSGGLSLPAASGARLKGLLESHHYTRGLAFVPQGTPTNNTQGTPPGYDSSDPAHQLSYRVERGGDLCRSGDGTNGDILSKALGLSPEVFARTRFAGELDPLDPRTGDAVDAGREQTDARHMNTVLWPATWGYYLSQLMAGAIKDTVRTVAYARRHFIDYVRARGPLPAVRVGRQPYGVLPVTSLRFWDYSREADKDLSSLAKLLDSLRIVWGDSLPGVPRLARADNPQEALLLSLSLCPTSKSYAVRNVLGPQFVAYYWSFLRRSCDSSWWNRQQEMARALLKKIGRDSLRPRLANFVSGGGAFRLSDVLVQGGASSESAALDPNYLEWVWASKYEGLRQKPGFDFKGGPAPLLYLLARHAKLLEYVNAAFRIKPPDPSWLALEPELINVNPGEHTLTVWEQLKKPLDSSPNSQTIGSYLDNLPDNTTDSRVADLLEFKRSLSWLKARPTAVLARLLPETLDLCAHRLDAWITSLATRRMNKLSTKEGVYLGGYGWVEDLRPAAGQTSAAGGFIHTPSLRQATAAAALRSGYLSHGKVEGGGAFAVDLSSERVRLALRLLDGVRQGQPLGALLGYRFERGLHSRQLDKYTAAFRRLAPLSTDGTELQHTDGGSQLTPAQEVVSANNVVDGLALFKRWKKGQTTRLWNSKTIPFGNKNWGLPNTLPPSPDFQSIGAELNALEAALDAIGDLLVGESVYQTAAGNHARAAAVLDALGRGDVPPPAEFEFVRTPRTGVGLTHRLLLPLGNDQPAASGWPTPSGIHQRARVEPALDAWVGELLGAPARVLCRAEYLDLKSGESLAPSKDVPLSGLDLTPLDLLYLTQGAAEAQGSELEQRLVYWLLGPEQRPEGVGPDAVVRLSFARDASWPAGTLSVAEFLEVVRSVRQVVTSSRALEPRDLSWPEDGSLKTLNVQDLQGRAEEAVESLKAALNDLNEAATELQVALADADDPQEVDAEHLAGLCKAMLGLSYFGIQGAVPRPPCESVPLDSARILLQAAAAARVAQQRVELADSLPKPALLIPNPTAAQRQTYTEALRDYYVKLLQAVFGTDFKVLYRFAVPDADGSLAKAFARSTELQGGDCLNSLTWFHRVARVRAGTSALEAAVTKAGAINFKPHMGFQVGQLPYADGDRWVALPLIKPADGQAAPAAGRLSLVALTSDALAADAGAATQQTLDLADISGLLVDEWVEVIPNARETTGVTFNYREPGARPPQAILLGLAPAGQTAWTLDTLEATILEALELAKLRVVDPELLRHVGQFVPALFFALNQSAETVTTDFRRAAER